MSAVAQRRGLASAEGEIVDPGGAEAVVLLLRELVAVNRAILAVLEQRQPAATLTRDDRVRLGRLLPVLAATFGSDEFTARDCTEHDAAGLRLVLDGLTPKRLGKLLAKADDIPISGLLIRRGAIECQAQLWSVVAV